MGLDTTPWLLKETAVYLDPHQRCQDFFPTNEQSQREQCRADAHSNMAQEFSKEHGRLFFLPDDQRAICHRLIGASKNILELQLIDFAEASSTHPLGRPLRVHFDSPILPSIDVFSMGGPNVVCWVCMASGPVIRLQLSVLEDFSSPGRPLVRQQFAFQGLESELTLFKALDATSVVAATASGTLFHGELVDHHRSFVCKAWKQASLMSSLLSPLSRFVRSAVDDIACYQTVSLASYALSNGAHLVFSLCRDRAVRVWSTRTHQQVQVIPLVNLDFNGNAIDQPAQLLSGAPVDVLRVYPDTLDTIRLVVHSHIAAGPSFLMYQLKLSSGDVTRFDFERCLVYRENPSDMPKLVDFFLASRDSVDILWAVWNHAGKNTIAYLPHNFVEGSSTDFPFPYECNRWLPVAPDTCDEVQTPQVDPEASPDEIAREFMKFLGQPNLFTLRAIKYAADLHFRDKPANIHAPRSYETPHALFAFLQRHMGVSLPKDADYRSRLIEEWTNFAELCLESKQMMHRPVSLSAQHGTVLVVYGDAIGVLRTCDPLEALSDCISNQLPRFLEGSYLMPLIGDNTPSLDRLYQSARLVELFQLSRSIWHSPGMVTLSQELTEMINDPDASSALILVTQKANDILSGVPEVARLAMAAHNEWDLLVRIHSLLDLATSPAPEPSQAEAPSSRFLPDALVASAFKQLTSCRGKLARDLLLIYLAAGASPGLDDLRARECIDRIEAMWRYFGTQSLFLGLFTALPIQPVEKKSHSRRSSAFVDVSLDVTLSRFHSQKGNSTVEHSGLQTPPYYWFSLFQGFMRNIAKPADILSCGLTPFACSLMSPLSPGLPETSPLFYQLLTWLELKGQYDLALLFVRYLQVIPAKNFLAGRIMLAQGRFESAYCYLSSVAVDYTFECGFTATHPLRGLLPQDLLEKGLSAYLGHMALWFQNHDAYEGALLFCHRALVALPQNEDASTLVARNSLWRMSFELTLAQQNYAEAYYAVLNLSDRQIQAETLRVLIVTMCAEEKVEQLCKFPFPGLEGTFETIVWDLIHSIVSFENLSVNYFTVLASFYMLRQDIQNAASSQYHYLLWLTAQTNLSPDVLPNWLDQQVLAAQFSATNLAMLPESSSWLKTLPRFLSERERLTPYFGPTKAPLEVATSEMISRLHAILIAQRDLPATFPRYRLIREPMAPSEVIGLLLESQAFPQALQISLCFQLNLSPVFQRLAAACANAPEFQNQDSVKDENPWPLLRSSLDQFTGAQSIRPGEYELAALSVFLAAGWWENLPTWLIKRSKDLNKTGVISLLLQHSYVEQSAELASDYLLQLLDQSNEAVPGTFSQFFPVNLMDKIAEALKQKKSEVQLASFRKLLDQYLERAQANTAAIVGDKVV